MKNHLVLVFLLALLIILLGSNDVTAANANSRLIVTSQVDTQSWIAYIGADYNIWLVHPDGSGSGQLTADASNSLKYQSLKWSPDGMYLAFSREEMDENYNATVQVKVLRVDNLSIIQTVQDTSGGFDWISKTSLIYDRPTRYSRNDRGCPTILESYDGLYVIDIFTGQSQPILAASGGQPLLSPEISSDHKNVILRFDANQTMYGAAPYQLASITYGGIFTPLDGTWYACDWSNGSLIVACDTKLETCDSHGLEPCPITLYDPTGKVISTLSTSPKLYDLNPSWSRDDKHIAVTASDGYFFADGPCVGGSGPTVYGDNVFVDIISTTDWTRRRLTTGMFEDWSPDNKFVLISRPESVKEGNITRFFTNLVIVDIQTGEETAPIAEGSFAVWQPRPTESGQEGNTNETLKEWIARKDAVIHKLTAPEYNWLLDQENYGNIPPLPPVDEGAAQELLAQISEDPTNLTAENREAFYRLLLQEETLMKVHESYMRTSDDMGETWADILDLSISSVKIYAGHEAALTLFQSFVEDSGHVFINMHDDPQEQEQLRTLMDLMLLYVFNGSDPGGYIQDLGPEAWMRWLVASDNQRQFNSAVEPLVDRGVNSVYANQDPYWNVNGTSQQAEDNTEYLIRQSADFTDFSHENYVDTRNALGVAKVINDASDLAVQVTKGKMPWYVAASKLYSTAWILYLNWWKLDVNIQPSLNCSLDMARDAGYQSFAPDDPNDLPVCISPEFPFGEHYELLEKYPNIVDASAWAQFKAEYSTELDAYATLNQELSQKKQPGKTISANDRQKLDQLITRLESILARGSAIITPRDGQAWDEQTLAIMLNLIEIKAQTALLLMTVDLTEEDLADPDVQRYIDQNFNSLQQVIERNQDMLDVIEFIGPPDGIPLIELIGHPGTGNSSEVLIFQLRLKNIGGASLEAGKLTVALAGSQQPSITSTIPSIESGDEQVIEVMLDPSTALPNIAVVTYMVGDRTITRYVVVSDIVQVKLVSSKFSLVLAGGLISLLGGVVAVIIGALLLKQKKAKGKAR